MRLASFFVLLLPALAVADPELIGRLGEDRFRQKERVEAIVYSPDGKQIATSERGAIHLWDASTGRRLRTIPVKELLPTALGFADRGRVLVALANQNSQARLLRFEVKSGKGLADFRLSAPKKDTPSSEPRGVFSPDGSRLAVVEEHDGRLTLLDAATGKTLLAERTAERAIEEVTFSPDNKLLAVGTVERLVIYSAETGTLSKELPVTGGRVIALAISPDGKDVLYESNTDAVLELVRREITSGKVLWRLAIVIGNFLAFSADGKTARFYGRVESEPLDERWRWVDLGTGKLLPQTLDPEYANDLALRPDGKILALGGFDGRISQWDLATRQRLDSASADPVEPVRDLRISKDGTKVIGWARGWYEWDARTGKQARLSPKCECGASNKIVVSPDQKWLAVIPVKQSRELAVPIEVIELATGRRSSVVRVHQPEVLRFLPDSRLALTNPVGLWLFDVVTGKTSLRIDAPQDKEAVAISDDGTTAVTLSPVGDQLRFTRWDLAANRKVEEKFGRVDDPALMKNSARWQVELSANGKQAAVYYSHLAFQGMGFNDIYEERTALFDVRAGRFLSGWADLHLRANVAFSPDGRTAACYYNSSLGVDLREVATGERRGHILERGETRSCTFSTDGRKLAIGATPGPVELWDLLGQSDEWEPVHDRLYWEGLASELAEQAYLEIAQLRLHPAKAVALLKKNTVVPTAPTAEWLAANLKELDSADFRKREAASAELGRFGEVVLSQLRAALAKATPEVRERLQALIAKAEALSREKLRMIRSCEALEGIATAEAGALLAEWAKGPAGSTLTREAADSLERLKGR
jgi:WD40 repeat protein